MALKRTISEIVARMAFVKDTDFFGTQHSDMLSFLPFEQAKPYLNDGVTAQQWDEARDQRDPLVQAKEYLSFAWDKANNCRGLSASRSMDHMSAFFWLAGYDGLMDYLQDMEFYGKPQLVVCSELVGFDWREADNGEWTNNECAPGLSVSDRADRIAEAVKFAEVLGMKA